MRLFLSSYRAGNYPEKLTNLFGEGADVAVVTNAKDYKTPEERQTSVDEILDFLSSLAMKPVEIDLRAFFKDPESFQGVLERYPAVWMAGGNTFVLRRALKHSGADRVLGDLVRKNEIILGGESAGAIITTPTLTGVEFGDDPDTVPEGYDKKVIYSGLNLVDYHIVPHYQSEWEGAEKMMVALANNGLRYRTLTDSQAITIDGDKEEFLK
jgi:dipeptidase E